MPTRPPSREAPRRRFFVELPQGAPDLEGGGAPEPSHHWSPGSAVRLLPEEEHHARHVLRLRIGDRLWGLDGRGHEIPLALRSTRGRGFVLEVVGQAEWTPPPGSSDAEPWIEIGCALPRPQRLEAMIDRLTQLGLARLSPLLFQHSPEHARRAGAARMERLRRVAREACKQSGRRWLPHIEPPRPLTDWLTSEGPPLCHLAPGAPMTLLEWLRRHGSARRRILVGPEGGLSEEERAELEGLGAVELGLGPRTLRIETAAELACGLAGLAALGA